MFAIINDERLLSFCKDVKTAGRMYGTFCIGGTGAIHAYAEKWRPNVKASLNGGLQNRGYGFAIINDEQLLGRCRTAGGTAVGKISNSG